MYKVSSYLSHHISSLPVSGCVLSVLHYDSEVNESLSTLTMQSVMIIIQYNDNYIISYNFYTMTIFSTMLSKLYLLNVSILFLTQLAD